MSTPQKHINRLDDSIFTKSREQLREEYKEMTGHYPEPLTDEEKKKYGLI